MTGARTGALAAMLALAACQPLPHPFADDRPPAALLRVPDSLGVSIGPIAGQPEAAAARLGAAMAQALQSRDIPASNRTASLASLELDGRIAESPPHLGRRTLTAFWRLHDAKGRVIGPRKTEIEATVTDWKRGDDSAIGRLAASSAAAVAPLIAGTAPVEVAHDDRVKIRIGKVGGAPGDGDHSLATALAAVLKRHDVDIVVGNSGAADLTVEAKVVVTPVDPGKEHVKIVWRVRRADGKEIGTVGQENDVPRGMVGAAWGDVAYSVALAAESGILQLVAHAGPPAGGKS